MALDPVANFVRGSTDASVDNTTTTISVVDATIFPDPSAEGGYNLVLWAADSFPRPDQDPSVEVVRVTARDTGVDELTVTRGQEGTTAAAHPSGSALQLSPTAKMFSDIQTKTSGLSDDGNSLSIDVALFPVEFPSDVSGSRSFGTWYQNTTNHPLALTVRVENDGNGLYFGIDVNTSQNPNTRASYANTNSPTSHRQTLSIVVPDQSYYQVRDFSSTAASILSWTEQAIGK